MIKDSEPKTGPAKSEDFIVRIIEEKISCGGLKEMAGSIQ